ncbi:variant erythrocyte surface antigen-1 alpha subunit [Babesia bovis T2Bo]|uniref:Variant erythrocyte surface antigen-1, alpha subunit n=1 Tax=Babesia bovis TaxID=5865 RepID=A7ANN4_BABBO|nr:variant erythrocyte surface antigen-1 alpha subunit [Babesia bovis T2Bo]EDO08168.1 variant erythrocyte surface antigen-1 alpha subunit [Babesia bovis T2Bo]|eukprot:XP_001611736.1 variant erythrocyte surface antigen-1, alpha subunit [Babesia bovis T2Bo]
MAVNSTFTPKASLTEAPTNLKEAIDWVLRVTGRDGKALSDGECICGLAAAVTDLLQSVELEYYGYEGDVKEGITDSSGNDNRANAETVKGHLNGLFSLVQGLGGTAVVRTYIDQLAQVLSALVGWSRIEKCKNGGCEGDKAKKCTRGRNSGHSKFSCCCGTGDTHNPGIECCKGTNYKNGVCANGCCSHGGKGCKYIDELEKNLCNECECIKGGSSSHLGRGCTKCKDSGDPKHTCKCGTSGTCKGPDKCQCAKEGKCCKCSCKDCRGCKENAKCSCTTEKSITLIRTTYGEASMKSYMSSYSNNNYLKIKNTITTWKDLISSASNRHQCARIFLGSVCLIWSGITYMYWTGKWHGSSPRWNNHILDGSGLDDGTLFQWLQALGFPKDMLNNSGPGNRLDGIINDEVMEKLFLGFKEPDYNSARDGWGNTARNPTSMNYPGFIHTAHRDSFNNEAKVFPNGTDTNQHKRGALFKLYILSCAYFTGLQKKPITQNSTPKNPKTIREILYWLSALPYSKAYPKILKHGKERLAEVLKKPGDTAPVSDNEHKELKFYQEKLWAPITVHEFNLFAHFQAVTQYCPLVLIGIQGGLHSATKGTKEPPIHSLYANTECNFTYPTVSIQAYNQVVHYIRALFYQLYFLRKQCAVKVAMGGKWRECRYGKDVVSKGVISWMCLGCDPMEHDRKSRVNKVKEELRKVVPQGNSGDLPEALKDLLEKIGEVVVQLGNAQERLDRGEIDLTGVRKALNNAVPVDNWTRPFRTVLKKVLDELVKKKVKELGKAGGQTHDGQTSQAINNAKKALETADKKIESGGAGVDGCKNAVSAAIDGLHKVLEALLLLKDTSTRLDGHKEALLKAIKELISICNSPKCSACDQHSTKCGQKAESTICEKCLQPTTTGVPSPLQAFLEDRLPGFSCQEVPETENPDYPLAASHLWHCNGSGQCCPLPMGFRNNFQDGVTNTGHRLYGLLYFFSNENMMQSCVYALVRVTAALSATTPQVLGDVFGFFRGGVGEKEQGMIKDQNKKCDHSKPVAEKRDEDYFCGWCASGLRDVVKEIEWIPKGDGTDGGKYRETVGKALINIKGDKDTSGTKQTGTTSLSRLTENCQYLSPLTGELYTAVSATFGGTYLSWVLYLSDALEGGLKSLSEAFQQIECRGCRDCDPNKCKKGEHGQGSGQCGCQSIVSCTGVLPVLYRHGFSYGNPFNLEGYEQKEEEDLQFDIVNKHNPRHCHEFLDSLKKVIENAEKDKQDPSQQDKHPLTNLLTQVGQLQYDIRLPWIFVLTLAWLVAVLYLAFGALWPLDWTHMRSHWLRGGAHQWQCMWYKVMTGRKGMELVEYFGKERMGEVKKDNSTLRTVLLSGAKGWGAG